MPWSNAQRINAQDYRCGFCHKEVAADKGWVLHEQERGLTLEVGYVCICPRCDLPTFLMPRKLQVPGAKFGEPIEHLPEDVAELYTEAGRCMSVGATTAAVLIGRKLLMHVAVEKEADTGQTFAFYVSYLVDAGIVTVDMKEWVDEIRGLGNDANHELVEMSRAQAEELLTFVAMLLKVVYEYPEKGRRSVAARTGSV